MNNRENRENQLTLMEMEINSKNKQIQTARENFENDKKLWEAALARQEQYITALCKKKDEMISNMLLFQLGLEKGMILERIDGMREIFTNGRATIVGAHSRTYGYPKEGNISIDVVVTKKNGYQKDYKIERVIWAEDLDKWRIYRRAPKKKIVNKNK